MFNNISLDHHVTRSYKPGATRMHTTSCIELVFESILWLPQHDWFMCGVIEYSNPPPLLVLLTSSFLVTSGAQVQTLLLTPMFVCVFDTNQAAYFTLVEMMGHGARELRCLQKFEWKKSTLPNHF
jgi:hypothetical protein